MPSSHAWCPEKVSGPVTMVPPRLPHSVPAVSVCSVTRLRRWPCFLGNRTLQSHLLLIRVSLAGAIKAALSQDTGCRHKGPEELKPSLWPRAVTAGAERCPHHRQGVVHALFLSERHILGAHQVSAIENFSGAGIRCWNLFPVASSLISAHTPVYTGDTRNKAQGWFQLDSRELE